MGSKSLISVLILYLSFDHVHQHGFKMVEGIKPPTDKEWDYLIFTQQWPGSSCKVWTHKKPNHHCVFPNKTDAWTVHGIWPSKGTTKGPFNCNNTWIFDPAKIKPIETELEQAWTNIEKETHLYDFWAHEWNKHGTCAAMIEPFNNELKYFSKGINFLYKYHMTDILNAANILPSNTKELNVQDITKAVTSKLGKRPFTACETEDGIQYLIEIRICMDKQLNLIDCLGEEQDGCLTNCHPNKGIIYPTQVPEPKKYLVQVYKFVNWLQWFTL